VRDNAATPFVGGWHFVFCAGVHALFALFYGAELLRVGSHGGAAVAPGWFHERHVLVPRGRGRQASAVPRRAAPFLFMHRRAAAPRRRRATAPPRRRDAAALPRRAALPALPPPQRMEKNGRSSGRVIRISRVTHHRPGPSRHYVCEARLSFQIRKRRPNRFCISRCALPLRSSLQRKRPRCAVCPIRGPDRKSPQFARVSKQDDCEWLCDETCAIKNAMAIPPSHCRDEKCPQSRRC